MKKKKVNAVIEASATGYGVFIQDANLPLTGYGDTIEAAKEDLQNALRAVMEHFRESGEKVPAAYNNGNLEFEYKYDLGQYF